MSEQITPERQAEAEEIGHTVYQAMRAEMIEASRQREGIDTPLLMEGLEAEATYQAAREALTKARAERQNVHYAMWRANKDPRAVAALLPATVKAATVRAAVIKLAPRQDFEALPLWRTSDEEADATN
ncbi:hypothetical protein [Streptomyces candidus]|uniref:Uncharacterized protein n=1 Tax=Streptomyces candidus TaxID=67283 RepID=A0A7X0LSZ7_9ACTN|nr:hypothetical protein [Streptomyces candidus]MBB6440263.1 hypothetical protein [Streptomyces candidus]GHH58216.1 hypothetical protein GCM10018773_66320 [Streptomyces candidus]